MTLEERLEVATSGWLDTTEFVGEASFARESIEKLLRKAAYLLFPELFVSPPSHWLAPVKPTAEMVQAALDSGGFDSDVSHPYPAQALIAWASMQNAYLNG